MSNNLTVTIITLNEEKNILRALNSVKLLKAEIIIVDSGSNDKTVAIARKLGAKVFIRKFDNYANQKNFAAQKATGKWIFSLDGDEEIEKGLVQEILKVIKTDEFKGYLIGRRNFILEGEIKHSRWSPDQHIWLWQKKYGKWEGDVHEEVIVNGEVGELKGKKIHYQDKTVTEFFSSNNRYSEKQAQQLHTRGIRFSWDKFIWDPIWEFVLRYFLKSGFLDGWRGFILCFLMAVYKLSVWVKVYEIEHNLKKS